MNGKKFNHQSEFELIENLEVGEKIYLAFSEEGCYVVNRFTQDHYEVSHIHCYDNAEYFMQLFNKDCVDKILDYIYN